MVSLLCWAGKEILGSSSLKPASLAFRLPLGAVGAAGAVSVVVLPMGCMSENSTIGWSAVLMLFGVV